MVDTRLRTPGNYVETAEIHVCANALAQQKPVPRFFIDLHDGVNLVRDHDGFDLPDLAAARSQAVRMMTRLAQGLADPQERQDFVIAVRDAQGAVRLRLRLSYDTEPG